MIWYDKSLDWMDCLRDELSYVLSRVYLIYLCLSVL